jgi:hypothetical protein
MRLPRKPEALGKSKRLSVRELNHPVNLTYETIR